MNRDEGLPTERRKMSEATDPEGATPGGDIPFAAPVNLDGPNADVATVAGSSGRVVYPFASGRTRAKWAVGLIAANLVFGVLLIGSSILQILLLNRIAAGDDVAFAVLENNDIRHLALGGLHALSFYMAVVAFSMWFHRVHRNLPSLAAGELKYTPGWGVAYFFIPIVQLFRPVQVMGEIWRGSDPGNVQGADVLPNSTNRVALWWTFWILGVIGERIIVGLSRSQDSASLLSTWAAIGGVTIFLVAGLLLVSVIRTIDKNQTTRHKLLQTELGTAHRAWGEENRAADSEHSLDRQLADALFYGVDLVAERVYYPDWSASMTLEFGEWVAPHLDDMFPLAKKIAAQPRGRWKELIDQACGE